MTEYREEHERARDAGLGARHETRLRHTSPVPAEAIEAACDRSYGGQQLTASHARYVLEAAYPVIRHEIAEEIAAYLDAAVEAASDKIEWVTLRFAARAAREIGSKGGSDD
ncbi:hypothetical protein [Kribbella sp. NPDC050470]|uniref:hypothetical protein n=1 Tax=unclassified Kribbella TaxID=2644121 RepID=UPI0037A1B003